MRCPFAEKDFEEIILERERQARVVMAMIFSWIILILLIAGSFIFIFQEALWKYLRIE